MYRLLKKRAIALVMMLIMIITLVPANEVSAKTSKKAVPALKESSATLYVKGKYATEYQIEIENLVSGATVTYESSDEKIATVNEKGVVTPVKKGETSISVTVSQKKKTYKLSLDCKVKKATLKFTADKAKSRTAANPAIVAEGKSLRTGLKLNGKYVSVFSSSNSEDYNVKAVIYDAKTGKQLTAKRYAGNNRYINISETGILTAKKAGEYYIVFTSYPKGCENTIYVNVTKAEPTPTEEPAAEPTVTVTPTVVIPTAIIVPTSAPTQTPAATETPVPASETKYQVKFAFTKNSEYLGGLAVEEGGAVLPKDGVYEKGTAINTLPIPEMWGGIFMGWYYDADMKEQVLVDDTIDSNLTLYAELTEGDGAELVETPVYYTVILEPEQVSDFSFEIKGYTSDIIDSFIDVADESAVSYTVVGDKVVPALEQGRSYIVTLKREGVTPDEAYFVVNGEAQLPSVVTLNIITEKEEVMNLSLADDMIFIPFNEISEVQGEMFEGLFIASADGENGIAEGNRYTGSFRYEGAQKLEVGSKVAIYEGTSPDRRGIDTMGTEGDGEIIYVTIVSADGTTYGYKNTDAEDVIEYTEVLPVSSNADKDNDASNHSITVDADVFDYSDSKYSELGLNADTVVNEGDFIIFYKNAFENAEFVSYARVTSVKNGTDEYIVGYVDVTEEEVKTSMDVYTKQNKDINLTDEEIALIEAEIQKQAYASGFIDEASEYLAALALETDGFKEMSDDLDFDLESYNIRLTDASVSDDTDNMSLMGAKVTAKVKKTKVEASIKPDQKLSHYTNRKGLKAGLKLSVTIEVTSDKIKKGHIEIDIVAFFEEEVFIDLTTSSKAIWKKKWIFPYIADYSITANLDFGTFTGVGITATIKTVETPEKLEVPDTVTWNVDSQKKTAEGIVDIGKQMKKLMESNGIFGSSDGSNDAAADSLSKKYADFIKKSGDSWITIVEKEIFEVEGGIDPLHILCFSLTCNFVVQVNLYLTMGVTLETGTAKRYTFTFSLNEKSATSKVVNLEDQYLQVEFYVFGTAGLKVGFELELGVGLLSAKLDSIGITAEVGAYAQLWGYFYLKYKQSVNSAKQKIVEKCYSGALFIEIGIYLEIHFKAQLFSSKKLTYEPTLYENQWPLVRFGAQTNIRNFQMNKGSAGYSATYEMVDEKVMTVPEDLFSMNYLDLKEGSAGTVNYDDNTESNFNITFSNRKFSYDAKNNKITVNIGANDNSIREEADMTITFKGNSLAFTSVPISIKIKVIWTNPANTRRISFDSKGGSVVNPIATAVGAAVNVPANPVKTGYVFDGWYSDSACTQKFTFPSTMPNYFVSPGFTGITVYAKWLPAKDTRYNVLYYLENPNGSYYLFEHIAAYGETDSVPSDAAFRKDIKGATYCKTVASPIKPEGSSNLELYYNLNEYTVTFTYGLKKDGTDNTKDVVIKGKYGSCIEIPEFSLQGYKHGGFNGGIRTDLRGRAVITENATYEAIWTPLCNTDYMVKAYLENPDGGYDYFATSLKWGETDSLPLESELRRCFYINGYSLNLKKSEINPISPDGSSVTKLYYDLDEFTVTFTWGKYKDEKHPDIVIENIKYGSCVETPVMEIPGYEVHHFNTIGGMRDPGFIYVYESKTYEAAWDIARDIHFTVEYYLQQTDGEYDCIGYWDKNGEAFSTPSLNELVLSSTYYDEYLPKAHYSLDYNKSVLSPITPDGEAVMKVYYSLDWCSVKFTYGEFGIEAGGNNSNIYETYIYGTEIELPEFEVLGYVHTGFEELPEGTKKIKITESAVYNATWELADEPYVYEFYVKNADNDEYGEPVRFNMTGKTGEVIDLDYSNISSEYSNQSKYVFEKRELVNVAEGDPFVSAAGDSVIKFYFDRKIYSIDFYAEDDFLGVWRDAKWGQKVDEPVIAGLVMQGYELAGWYTSKNGAADLNADELFDFDTDVMTAHDMKLYAGWRPAADTPYCVEYMGQMPDMPDVYQSLDSDELFGTTGTTVTADYKSFAHYVADTTNENNLSTAEILADGSTELCLYYNLETVTVTFDADGGILGSDVVIKNDSGITNPSVGIKEFRYGQSFRVNSPTREGYKFIGWKNSSTDETYTGTKVTEAVSLKAVWEEIEPEETKVKYYVYHYVETVDGIPGEPIIEDREDYEGISVCLDFDVDTNSFIDESLLVEGGIIFGGTQIDADAMGEEFDRDAFYQDPVVIEGMIIRVMYKREQYTITWNLEGYTPVDSNYTKTEGYDTVLYGTPIVKPEFSEKGYKYSFTPEVPDTIPNHDTEFSVVREPIEYIVKFDGNSATAGSMESKSVKYGIMSEFPQCGFTKEGYTFRGWALASEIESDADIMTKFINLASAEGAEVTVYAIWEQN